MLRAIILPIFRSARLCVTACGIIHPRRCRRSPGSGGTPLPDNVVSALYQSCKTQSSAPEDGQNNFPKHVELIGIVNEPLLLHPVGCLYYLYK